MLDVNKNGPTSWSACSLVLAAALAAALVPLGLVQAADEDEAKLWQEKPVAAFPAAPQAQNLLKFFVSATASQSFALDAKSVSISDDGVVHYTLVAQSASGVKNISFEGIRCASFEMKTYAFGRPDGSWSTARRDEWQTIVHNVSNRPQAALALDYFCQGKSLSGKVNEIVDKMRNQLVK